MSLNSGSPKSDNDSTDSIGRGMMYIAWGIGIALATWYFSSLEEKQYNPNQSPASMRSSGFTEVTLRQNRYGHYVTTGIVNDKEVVFLLDTGATDVAIPASLEKYLDLQRGYPIQVHTANGTATAYKTKIDYLKIGDIVLNNVSASITPTMQGEDILLGMAALKQLEFRQKGKYLTLIQQ